MTTRNKIQLKELFDDFNEETECINDCRNCEYAVFVCKNKSLGCPISVVRKMIWKWVEDGKI